jgi:hypothetical protein
VFLFVLWGVAKREANAKELPDIHFCRIATQVTTLPRSSLATLQNEIPSTVIKSDIWQINTAAGAPLGSAGSHFC